jgi:NO-binding membrane sensor protein with MHYT domain
MAHVNEAAYGWVTPTFAYLFSFLGCLLGLNATARARLLPSGARKARWLVLAAWAIGGTGIWVMHFVAMIGFQVSGATDKFDPAITIASWLIAVIVVGLGLFLVGYTRPTALKIIVAGFFTGIGVAAMHYTGMAAMTVDGTKSYDRTLVIASVVIAVVAATVALWFTVSVRRTGAVVVAALIMAFAVCGMHYTGMFALGVKLHANSAIVNGWDPTLFLVPIFIFVLIVVVVLGYAMLNSLSEEDAAALSDLEARLSGAGSAPLSPPAQSAGFTVHRTGNRR